MTKIISLLNHKGGTSKTTSTLNAGVALSRLGHRLLLMDLDPQANLSQSLGIEIESGSIADVFDQKLKSLPIVEINDSIHLVPSSLELSAVEPRMYSNINSYFILRTMLEAVKEKYDFVLIDCPPSLGIFTQNALIASNSVLIPVQAQFLALKGLDTVYNLISTVREQLNPSLYIQGLLVTQTNHTKLSKDILASLKQTFKDKVYSTTIRQNVSLAEASAQRQDIFAYSPESYGAIDYMNLAKELLQ